MFRKPRRSTVSKKHHVNAAGLCAVDDLFRMMTYYNLSLHVQAVIVGTAHEP
jgi:hypothetical protein